MIVEEIDQLAKGNSPMPNSLYISEQWLFSTLRLIYDSFQRGIIDEKQGRREKLNAVKQYESMQLWETIFRKQAAIGKELGGLMSEANKNGCDICKRMAGLIDGRIVPEEMKGDSK